MTFDPSNNDDRPIIIAVNGFAVAALVLGVVGIVVAFVPFVGVLLGGVLGLAGVVTGVIGRRRAADEDDPKRQNMGLSTGGIVASAIALVVVTLQVIGIVTLTDVTVEEFGDRVDSLGNYVPGIEPTE